MISVLASSAVDRGFEPRSDQIKPKNYKIDICCFFAKHATLIRRKTGWLGIRIMYPNGATCLSTHCCFSELTQVSVLQKKKRYKKKYRLPMNCRLRSSYPDGRVGNRWPPLFK